MFIVLQIFHFDYFNYFIFPMEIILFFIRQSEVYEPFFATLSIKSIYPIFILGVGIFLFVSLNKFTKHRYQGKIGTLIFLLILIFPLIRISLHFEKRHLGAIPNSERSVLKNSMYMLTHFIGKTLPIYVFDLQLVESWKSPEFKKRENYSPELNIVFILGESLTSRHMPLFGYERNTTPFLSAIVQNNPQVIYKESFSSGLYTGTSIPMFINSAKKPNATIHVLEQKYNLFKIAKDQGLVTQFLSAQSRDEFRYIKNYLAPKYIDTYIDANSLGYQNSILDMLIIDHVKSSQILPTNQHHFAVLNMNGSHEPYQKRVPQNYAPFGTSNYINQYDNTIRYTDLYIENLYQYLEQLNKKTILIYTSDHGQHVKKDSLGKGDISNINHALVPFILIPINMQIDARLNQFLSSKKYVSHYQIALSVLYLLGLDSLPLEEKSTLEAYVLGAELSGNTEYAVIQVKDNRYNTTLPEDKNIIHTIP